MGLPKTGGLFSSWKGATDGNDAEARDRTPRRALPRVPLAAAGRRALRLCRMHGPDRARVRPRFVRQREAPARDRERAIHALALRAAPSCGRTRVALPG